MKIRMFSSYLLLAHSTDHMQLALWIANSSPQYSEKESKCPWDTALPEGYRVIISIKSYYRFENLLELQSFQDGYRDRKCRDETNICNHSPNYVMKPKQTTGIYWVFWHVNRSHITARSSSEANMAQPSMPTGSWDENESQISGWSLNWTLKVWKMVVNVRNTQFILYIYHRYIKLHVLETQHTNFFASGWRFLWFLHCNMY